MENLRLAQSTGRLLSLPSPEKISTDKRSSLFCCSVSDEERKISDKDTWDQFYKTFYGRKLQLFIIS